MCYSAPSKHRNWTVNRRHKMLSASIFILWEWWVRFKEHLHTSAVLHLKETLNNWRLRAEMASWSACIKLWGLDPGLKNTYTNLYITVFLKKITYFVLSKLIARDITLYYMTVAKRGHETVLQNCLLLVFLWLPDAMWAIDCRMTEMKCPTCWSFASDRYRIWLVASK